MIPGLGFLAPLEMNRWFSRVSSLTDFFDFVRTVVLGGKTPSLIFENYTGQGSIHLKMQGKPLY
jgi:hypothetical protein